MLSPPKNRVKSIKDKFENLSYSETAPLTRVRSSRSHLCKQSSLPTETIFKNESEEVLSKSFVNGSKCDETPRENDRTNVNERSPEPNSSYLYNSSDNNTSSESRKTLSRQSSDPGKKLHRSHAFRCDRSKIVSPKRHGSCKSRPELNDNKMEGKLSEEKLKRLGHVLEKRMKLENFVASSSVEKIINVAVDKKESVSSNIPDIDISSNNIHESPTLPMSQQKTLRNLKLEENSVACNSVPDEKVPKHILEQYAKVVKAKKQDEAKNDGLTDSGVSSETENHEDDKVGKIQKLKSQFEKTDTNLNSMDYLCASSETMRLEKKNPHVKLTDTLKKALKQPLPPGPPPQKPPRIFTPEKGRKDAIKMLEKLEKVLEQREQQKVKHIYDIAEENQSIRKPKEIHYLCTEILDIPHNKLLPADTPSPDPFLNCFSLNCAIIPKESTLSLPYTRLSESNRSSLQTCCCSKENLQERRLSTFLSDKPCEKCNKIPTNSGVQCEIGEKERIYDLPYCGVSRENKELPHVYGSLNRSKSASLSRSLDDLRIPKNVEDKIIYDIPCEVSRSPSPEFVTSSPKSKIEKLRKKFENPTNDSEKNKENKKPPLLTPKPNLKLLNSKNKFSKSTENISEVLRLAKNVEKKFATEKRYKKNRSELQSLSLIKLDDEKKEYPLEKDRENLTRLMNEIYETVTAACNMEDHKTGSFPTDHQDSTNSDDSVKIHRSLTEKRKTYVRRVSSKVAYLDPNNIRTRRQTSVCSYNTDKTDIENPYSTFRSWKSFRKSSYTNIDKSKMALDRTDSIDSKINLTDSRGNILSMKDEFSMDDSLDNLSIDEKTGCVDITLPFERERGLFKVCLLVGLNYMTGQAYVKSVFPTQVKLPPHIENLIYPETLSDKVSQRAADVSMQCYSLVLTDERGERAYGYCRRVVPEGASTCLPLCYCVIGKYRAPGFYYKVLQEIESHHGSSELEISSILQQLFDSDFPEPGREISITYCRQNNLYAGGDQNKVDKSKSKTMPGTRMYYNSDVSFSDKIDLVKSASQKDCVGKDSVFYTQKVPEYYDLENNNANIKMCVDYSERRKVLKRPLEPRVEEDNLSVLLDCLGSGLLIKVFGSLLLERKVVIISDNLSQLSSCMEGLQALLYPLVWQQPLISTIPAAIRRDVLDAPLPVLAGVLKAMYEDITDEVQFDEGMLLDLTQPGKVIHYQGDEATILPTSSFKTLKTTLQMEPVRKGEDTPTRNILISEAFLRFFVNVLGNFWRFFGKDSDSGDTIFDKESFVRSSSSKQNQYFLEWFTETAMFNHFIQNMATIYNHRQTTNSVNRQTQTTELSLVDAPLPDFYQIFEDRVQNSTKTVQKSVDSKNNYKNLVNKRVKVLKTKLKDLVA